MASWQAQLAVWIVKWRVKRKLHNAKDYKYMRRVLRPEPYTLPESVKVSPAEVGGIGGEWLEGTQSNGSVLLYLHGGGYFGCSAETHRPITASFARQGFRVYAPNYRLAPESKFPAAVEDAVAAYRGLLSERCEPRRIVVAGDSAGGGLALSLLLSLRQARVPLPAGAALFSPWTDLAATGESVKTNTKRCAMFHGEDIAPSARMYLGDTDPRDPVASPVYADLTGMPPMVIHVGENEVLRDDSTRLAERAKAAGVRVELKVWPVVPHAWQLAIGKIPEARTSLRESGEFLKNVVAETATQGSEMARAAG